MPRDCACGVACLCVLGLLLLVERDELRLRGGLLLGRERRQRGCRLLKLLLTYRQLRHGRLRLGERPLQLGRLR